MKALITLFFFAVALYSSSVRAGLKEAEYNELSDKLGLVNAWRMTPEQLLQRCELEAPTGKEERQVIFQRWQEANQADIALIDQTVMAVAPLYAEALKVSSEQALHLLGDATISLIQENYFKDAKFSPAQICADYAAIVGRLSEPGKVAVTRGHVYQIEMIWFRHRKGPYRQAPPNKSFKADAVPARP